MNEIRESRVRAALRSQEKPLYEGAGPKPFEVKLREDTQVSSSFAKGDRVTVFDASGTVVRVDRQVWVRFDRKRGPAVGCNPHVVKRV